MRSRSETLTTELILGFGRLLRHVRERESLTQKELAEGMGVSLNQIKKYEQENLEEIGPNGYSIMVLAKLAEFLKTDLISIFSEIISYTDLKPKNSLKDSSSKLLSSISAETLETFLSLANADSKEPFGNSLKWNLEMAAALSKLPETSRAKIGLEIYHELLENNIVKTEQVAKQMKALFTFTLSNHD